MLATMIGAENNSSLRPRDRGIVEGQPRHAEDDRVMAEACNVERDVFHVRSDLKLDRNGCVGDGAGRYGAPINDLESSG